MISTKSATVLCVAIFSLNLNQCDTKTIDKDSDKLTNATTDAIANSTTTPSSSVNRFLDIDGIIHSFFPNFNIGGGSPGNFQNYPNNGNQVSNPQENNWNNGNWDAAIHYPDSPQNYPGQNLQGSNPQYPRNDFNNNNGGNYPANPNTPQGNNVQYPGNNFNDFNGGTYPVNPNIPQDNNNNQQYPGNNFNNLNGGNYPVTPNTPQDNNPQYPGNGFNDLNGGNYPVNPNIPQGNNNHQYTGNDFNNLNGGSYPVNPNIPQDNNNNQQYPGNHFINYGGGNYPVNPNTPQQSYPQYPGAGSNLDNNNNWNDNGYPATRQNRPSYPNEQGQYSGSGNGLNNINGLENSQFNPNRIVFPNNQVPMQGVPQGQAPGLNQGQPQHPRGTSQNGNPGLQNGGSFNPQDSNGLNNLPNVNYPQTNGPETPTEKVAILGLPVTVSNETTQKPLVNASTSSAMKQCVQDCPSTSEYNPVCGSNNVTYFNEGKIRCARFCGIDVATQRNGACASGPTPGVFG